MIDHKNTGERGHPSHPEHPDHHLFFGECPDCPDPIIHLRAQARPDLYRVYVWEAPVRITHWVIVLAIVILSVTGIYIGNPFIMAPGEAGERFVMGTVKAIHYYAAIAFVLAVLARLIWMFTGNQAASWDKYLPLRKRRFRGLFPTLRFYLLALRKPPGFVGHNPLAGLAYSMVFLLYLAMIATGLAMLSVSMSTSWVSAFDFLVPLFGGLTTARWIHHIIMWLLLGFAVHHVYSAFLMSVVEQNATIESMFSGYKFVPREDIIFSGYRFVPREYHHEEEPVVGDAAIADSGSR